MSVYRDPS